MRLLEVLLLLTLLASSLSLFFKPERRPRWMGVLPVVSLMLVLLHLWIEGARWQLVPAYGLTLLFLPGAVRAFGKSRPHVARTDRKALRILGGVGSLLMLGISVAAAEALPVFELPEPSGPYVVGTAEFMLEDASRPEIITEDPDDHRALMVRVWYPAAGEGASHRKDYMPPAEAKAFARKYGLPPFVTSHLRLVKTYAFEDAPMAADEPAYPVLLFSHGYNVPPSTYTAQLSEIASRGFLVFAVNHTYESTASVFPDGRVATFDYGFAGREYDGIWEQIGALERRYWKTEDASEKRNIIREIGAVYPISGMVHRWAEDLSFVIDELARLHDDISQPPYLTRLDLNRLGVFGHSAGGATAGQVMLSDERIRAGVNWDGAQWGDMIDTALTRPFMRIEAVRDSATFAPNDLIYGGARRDLLYTVMITGAGHSSFSDIPLLIPIRQINTAGDIDPRRATEIISAYTMAFFERHLLEKESPLLRESAGVYPEATLHIEKGGTDELPLSAR